ncbi:MAG: T9SS type A sorting domain-containing protein [Flavobacteriales bacterium]
MKMVFYVILVVTIFSERINAQAVYQLSINNINATIHSQAGLFSSNGVPGFEVPTGSGLSSIYASSFWLAGYDSDSLNCLRSNIESYGSFSDLITGPYQYGMDSSAVTSLAGIYNRVYPIKRTEVINFQVNFGTPGYQIPQNILNWPGSYSFNSANYAIAPFHDQNQDGIYNPYDGDYPKMKGDEAVFFVRNDFAPHIYSGGIGVGSEYHFLIYAFNDPILASLYNTLFAEVTLINRGTVSLENAYFGCWTDLDIGNADDDFIGSNIKGGYYYGFNGDAFDDPGAGQYGYGNNPRVQAVVFLGGPKYAPDGLDNAIDIDSQTWPASIPYNGLGAFFYDGIIDNERMGMAGFRVYFHSYQAISPATGDPNNADSFYKYLSGKWLDGTPLYYGGTGHFSSIGAQNNGLTHCNYAFPGSSDPYWWNTNGQPMIQTPVWSEELEMNTPFDRRGVGTCGPFNFLPGDTLVFEVAYVFAWDSLGFHSGGSLGLVDDYVNEVRELWTNDTTTLYESFAVNTREIGHDFNPDLISLFPNPSSDFVNIDCSIVKGKVRIEIFDIAGSLLFSKLDLGSIITVDVADFTPGYYFVRVSTSQSQTEKKLIIIK